MSWRRGIGGFGGFLLGAAATGAYLTKSPSDRPTVSKGIATSDLCLSLSSTPLLSSRDQRLKQSVQNATEICHRVQRRLGLPGVAVAVSVNGQIVFQQGFGYSDLENGVEMTPHSVMRIASISKPMTMAMLAQQMEEGKVDITLPIQTYLSDYPQKTWEGSKVTITTQMLLSHLSGIRHYKTKEELDLEEEEKLKNKKKGDKNKGPISDADFKEFFLQTGCDCVTKALDIFKDDSLLHKPGTKYFYTTHGWTVVSAIVEKVAGVPFDKYAKRMFSYWGLKETYLDEHEPLIPNRVKHYSKDSKGVLINSPWVDNSCKWAGGGFLSSVRDLVKFAHIMMYSSQQSNCKNVANSQKPFLKRETMEKLWTGNETTSRPNLDSLYGLGWAVSEPFSNCFGCNKLDEKLVGHSGGAVGATSILLIQLPPPPNQSQSTQNDTPDDVKGVVVVMITNLIDAGLSATAKDVMKEFQWML